MTSEEDTTSALRSQDEVERARRFYASAEASQYLEPTSPERLAWRRVLLTLLAVEKLLRAVHDAVIAEGEIRLRGESEAGFQPQLDNLCERIAKVRSILVADKP